MKACERYELMISALLDGELGERDKAELSAHIVGCERCGALAAAFAAVSGTLTESLEEPPDELRGAVMEKVAAAAEVKRRQNRFMRLTPIIAAAACVAVVAVTLFAANHGVRSAGDTTAGGNEESFVSEPETSAGGTDGSASLYGAASGESGGAEPMEAPAPASTAVPAGTAMDGSAPETRSISDTMDGAAPEEAEAESEAAGTVAEREEDVPAALPELEVEVVAAGDGSFTAEVLDDSSGFFDPGTSLTVLSDETVIPGTRVTMRCSGVSFGTEPGAYYVTAEAVEPGE